MTQTADAVGRHDEQKPLVSVIVAVRNEEHHITAALRSILQQECSNCRLEIVVVDGESSDRTQELVGTISAEDPRVKLLINRRKKTPFAFNLGIQAAQGEYVCILGAHTTYAKDYVATCLEELWRTGAGGCSGRLITYPGAEGRMARLIAWALSHPFGTSSGSSRTRGEGFWDTIPYPLFLKSTVLSVGGYDTQLHRNQDNDLSQRLRARGHKLYITDKTYCEYRVSKDPKTLAIYAFRTGFWNFISMKKNPASMSVRHFVPAIFVAALIATLAAFFSANLLGHTGNLLARVPLIAVLMLYGLVSAIASVHIAFREKSPSAMLLSLVFALLHMAYGLGTLSAMARNARLPPSEVGSGKEVERTAVTSGSSS